MIVKQQLKNRHKTVAGTTNTGFLRFWVTKDAVGNETLMPRQ